MSERTILRLEVVETEHGGIEIRQEPRWYETGNPDRLTAILAINQLASAMLGWLPLPAIVPFPARPTPPPPPATIDYVLYAISPEEASRFTDERGEPLPMQGFPMFWWRHADGKDRYYPPPGPDGEIIGTDSQLRFWRVAR